MKLTVLAATAAALLAPAAWAQPAQQQQQLPSVVITGNPLRSGDIATPASVLEGDGLVLRRGSSIGETIDGLPGVSSTWFGPNANRPVIRGQDGDRILMLGNGGATLDASGLSFDHAVAIDPLAVERIEVLRGPAALLYGGSAIGGVVNAIDNRIPRAALGAPSGAVEARLGSAAGERALSALVEGGTSGFAVHADAFKRRTEDLRVPDFARPLAVGTTERRRRVVNSASDAEGGAIGGSFTWDRGYLGASVDTYRNDYGIVVEDDVTIRMRRDKLTVAGEVRPASGLFSALRGHVATTDYRHREVEGAGTVGTTFSTRGEDARVEAVHRALEVGGGSVEGTLGLQAEDSDFRALGEEAFVPTTRTRKAALFLLERWSRPRVGSISAGLRAERVQVDSAGDANPASAQFGAPRERRFGPRSASLGGTADLSPDWQLTTNASYTERAPTSYELYANGVHAATAAFERGNPDQRLERGRNLDVGIGWRHGAHHLKAGVFAGRFANYIVLAGTGDTVEDNAELLPVYIFRGVPARLHGLELEGGWRVLQSSRTVDLDARLDLVRGSRSDTGEPLPRLAPLRAAVGVTVTQGAWSGRVEVQHASAQERVPSTDTATPGWTLLNLSTSYRIARGEREALLFARLTNVTDRLAYSASAIGSVRALSPLPGRGLMVGVRASF